MFRIILGGGTKSVAGLGHRTPGTKREPQMVPAIGVLRSVVYRLAGIILGTRHIAHLHGKGRQVGGDVGAACRIVKYFQIGGMGLAIAAEAVQAHGVIK